ncbi:MAG: hypothetical protein ACI8UZ_002489, partial [Akkermansiaceae bacterium]
GNEGVDGGAGTAEVFMGGIDDGLGVGEVVEGGDHAVFDAEGFVDYFDDGGDAVGGAGGCGEEVVLFWIVEVVITADDDIEGAFFDGGGDDDFFDALVEVVLEKGGGAEFTGALEDDLAAGPVGGFDGVVFAVGDAVAVDRERRVIAGDLVVVPVAVDGIEFEKVGGGGGGAVGLVEVDEVEGGIAEGGAEVESADAAEAVDANFSAHLFYYFL